MNEPLANIGALYLEALAQVERLHRRLLDVIKDEFDRRGRTDITSVQALLIYNIADAELTGAEFRARGHYLGTDVSKAIKKLVETGFLDQRRSTENRRSTRVSLTEKGREIAAVVDDLYTKHVRTIDQVGGISAEDFKALNLSLERLDRFWTDQIKYRL